MRLVRQKLAEHDLEVRFGGRLVRLGAPTSTVAALRAETPTWRMFEDELTLDAEVLASKVSVRVLRAAIARVRQADEHDHFARVMTPLTALPTLAQIERAELAWHKLCGCAFDTDQKIVEATLKQFIWMVKRRACRLDTTRQIMPLILGAEQGGGKTEFVRKFLRPIADFTANMSLAEAIDEKQGDVLSFLAIVTDDIDPLSSKKAMAAFKRLVTGETVRRRILGTSASAQYEIRASFIGSANFDVSSLFVDPTGHRRLVALRFRNGDTSRGGDKRVWPTIRKTSMRLLWKSVDMNGPAPIDAIWGELAGHQATNVLEVDILAWLRGLDLSSPAVRERLDRNTISAKTLLELYQAQAGAEISAQRFGRELARLSIVHADLPFGRVVHTSGGSRYPLRPRLWVADAAETH